MQLLPLIRLLWSYRAPILAALAGAVVGFKAGHYLGQGAGAKAGREALQSEIMAQSITTREQLNEIRNNRPDTDALVKRLRDGRF